jgi:hypothetical protein
MTTGRLLVQASAARPTTVATDGVTAIVSVASPSTQLASWAAARRSSSSPA